MTRLEKNSVWQGTLSLMVLRTLLTMGEQHGYGIARRIEQTSEGKLSSRTQAASQGIGPEMDPCEHSGGAALA